MDNLYTIFDAINEFYDDPKNDGIDIDETKCDVRQDEIFAEFTSQIEEKYETAFGFIYSYIAVYDDFQMFEYHDGLDTIETEGFYMDGGEMVDTIAGGTVRVITPQGAKYINDEMGYSTDNILEYDTQFEVFNNEKYSSSISI